MSFNQLRISAPAIEAKTSSVWVRATCLFLLCCQNCIAVLAIKYNSRLPSADGHKSLSTIVVALVSRKRCFDFDVTCDHTLLRCFFIQVESIKVGLCLMYLLVVNRGFGGFFIELKAEIVDKPIESAKLLVPSLLYVAQNNLMFVAVSNLDPGAYQVTSQLKTLVTALFAIVILGVSPVQFHLPK
jgi:hypothetical protein